MGFFDAKVECVICNSETGLNRNKTKHGWICGNCMDRLLKKNISIFNIKKFSIEELKEKIEISSNISIDKLVPILNPGINLKEDEVCFYKGKAQSFNSKNVVTHYESDGLGASFRIAKGISVHKSAGSKKAVRENVTEKHDGFLYVTNMRIILIASKHGFEISIPKLLSTSLKTDGFIFQVGSKSYSVLTNDTKYILKLFELMNDTYNK